jgi:hypothetical protein
MDEAWADTGSGTYFFNVGSLLFIFWTLMLFLSVWEIHRISPKKQCFVAGTKWFSFVLPAIQAILNNIPPVTKIPSLAISLANFIRTLTAVPLCCNQVSIDADMLRAQWS